jgi:hypothetical protein
MSKDRYVVEMFFDATPEEFEALMNQVADLVMESDNALICSQRDTLPEVPVTRFATANEHTTPIEHDETEEN